MVNHLLLNFVIRELGTGKQTSRGNYSFHCPFCNHHKPKLEIQLEENNTGINEFHCWACDIKGKNLIQLFGKLKISQDRKEELKNIIKSTKNFDNDFNNNPSEKFKLKLPDEFISLKDVTNKNVEAKHALHYLKKRGVNKYDIIKYNIGYCEHGKYKDRIIFPIYNSEYELVFFDARTYKDNPLRYIKPECSKDIIANEHFINWNLPIILCEGIMDAISIKRNVIPLLGKIIQPELMKKLLTFPSNKIYIALDNDAIKKAVDFCEMLMNEGKEVYFIEMSEGDASYMGFEKFTKHIQNSEKLNYSKLLGLKLNI